MDPLQLAQTALLETIRRTNRRFVELLGAGPRLKRHDATPVDRLLESGARVMWVAAHPDDESFAGPLLAKAGPGCGNPVHFVVLTRGEGGECGLPCGTCDDLGAVRAREVTAVADLYGASLDLHALPNAGLPVESFPRRHEQAHAWQRQADPAALVARAIRTFRPDVLLTFAPDFGSTGHPEHQLASRFATAGVRLAAADDAALEGARFRVPNTYYVLNKYWFTRVAGMGFDPLPYTETFDVRQPCINGRACNLVAADHTLPHHTQHNDMSMMRGVLQALHHLYLYRADPFTEIKDPYEFHPVRGMG